MTPYARLLVGWLVGRLAGRSVGWSVGWSVGLSLFQVSLPMLPSEHLFLFQNNFLVGVQITTFFALFAYIMVHIGLVCPRVKVNKARKAGRCDRM